MKWHPEHNFNNGYISVLKWLGTTDNGRGMFSVMPVPVYLTVLWVMKWHPEHNFNNGYISVLKWLGTTDTGRGMFSVMLSASSCILNSAVSDEMHFIWYKALL